MEVHEYASPENEALARLQTESPVTASGERSSRAGGPASGWPPCSTPTRASTRP
jgi:hypothetical protein